MNKKALFLDRDGVINIDYGYVYLKKNFEFTRGIFDLCRNAISKNYLIIIVTNQAGIGRGLYTLEDFNLLTDWMCATFWEKGIFITKVYHSPCHPVYGLGEYKRNDEMRKPRPGMINKAADDYSLDLNCSVMIGDKYTDIQAGQNAGIRTNILFNEKNVTKLNIKNNFHVVKSLQEAEILL